MAKQAKNIKSVRSATDDFVKTIQSAIEKKELRKEDSEWLIKELDEMIEHLLAAKKNVASLS